MKRAVLLVLGILSVLAGLLLAAAGGAVAALLGQSESISTQPARMSGTGVALVAEHIRVDESSIPIPEGVGTLTLTVTSPDGRQLFTGTAKPDDLDSYLAGAPYDVVVDLASGGRATTRPVPGTQQPPPPAGQTFWLSQASGAAPSISSSLDPGTALVVMNADATPRVSADVVVTYRAAGAWRAAWGAVGAGILLVLLGIVFFWRARVARRRRDAARAAVVPAASPVAGSTVLPTSDAPVAPEVPAWAAAPVALSGAELAGPPTGAIVVERTPDGSAAVVSASEPPAAAPAPPQAGWYPGAAPAVAAAAAVVAGDAVAGDAADLPVETAGTASPSDAADPAVRVDAAQASDAAHAAEAMDATDSSDVGEADAVEADVAAAPEPTVADDAIDTWHDETRPVPVAAPVAVPVAGVEVAPSTVDGPVYDELSSWFRDEPGRDTGAGG